MTLTPDSSAATNSPALLRLHQVRYAWTRSAPLVLDLADLEVASGEAVFLRGPSGCGKSTLLSLMAGVLLANTGVVQLAGTDWRDLPAHRRDRWRADHVGYVFQQFNLLPYLSVLDNVALPCRFSAARAERARAQAQAAGLAPTPQEAARHWLAALDLPKSAWQRPASDLSVGQQQRVAAARALIGAPDLVIADEPTSALDEAVRESFMHLLLQACASAGSALVFVSHDARLARHFQRQIDLPGINRATSACADEVRT